MPGIKFESFGSIVLVVVKLFRTGMVEILGILGLTSAIKKANKNLMKHFDAGRQLKISTNGENIIVYDEKLLHYDSTSLYYTIN